MSKIQSSTIPASSSGRAPYIFAAISLTLISAVVAMGVLGYGFADYSGNTLSCLNTSEGHFASLPASCQFPIRSILAACGIFLGGCRLAAIVGARR